MMPAECYTHRVLVLDGVPETVEVLQAVFEPQGIQVMRDTAQHALSAYADEIDLVVLHHDSGSVWQGGSMRLHAVPHIVVGDGSAPADGGQQVHAQLRTPFHYQDLVRQIEILLGQGTRFRAASRRQL